MNDFKTVNYAVNEGVATIRLNRPSSLNSFNQELRLDLLAAVTKANADSLVRVVVIVGEGHGFCAGADLAETDALQGNAISEQIIKEYKPFLSAIYDSEKIYIAQVHGAAAGIGSALAMTCDFIVMSESAYIYQAFSAIGLIPDGGATWHLVNQLGYKRALEIVVDAKKLPAKMCVELGLANRCVNDSDLEVEVSLWAKRIARGAPLSQKYSKELLQRASFLTLPECIDLEAERQDITIASRDFQEGKSAFFEKRKPEFSGL